MIGFITVILFFESCILFLGVLCRQLWAGCKSVGRRALVGVVFLYLFCSTAVLGGAKVLHDPLFAGCFSKLAGTLAGSLLAGAVCFIVAFLLGFMPWYRLPKGSKLLMSFTDLISSHQGSFVSGHALYAVLFIIIFPSYSLVIPSLKKYEKVLTIIAGIFAVIVILSRLLSGNNYLTDISFGALYSLKFCMSFFNDKISLRHKRGNPVLDSTRYLLCKEVVEEVI